MKNNYNTYLQEDLDTLLISKDYSELNEIEKESIREQISSEIEYSMMRNTLLNVKNSFSNEEEIIPEESFKADLIERFNTLHPKKSSGFWSNLKNGFLPAGKNFFLTPAFQLSSMAILVAGLSIYFMNNSNDQATVALNDDNKERTEKINPEKPSGETISGGTSENAEQPVDAKAGLIVDDGNAKGESKVISNDVLASETKADKSTFAEIAMDLEDLKKSEEKKNNFRSLSEPELDELVVAEKSPAPSLTTGSGVTTNTVTDEDSKIITETGKKKDKEEVHSAYSKFEKESSNKDLPKNGISLGDKPELSEFLFTAL